MPTIPRGPLPPIVVILPAFVSAEQTERIASILRAIAARNLGVR